MQGQVQGGFVDLTSAQQIDGAKAFVQKPNIPGYVDVASDQVIEGDKYFKSGQPQFDVNAFPGVDPTGATDSTAGIQAALDAVLTGGGVVHFHGMYKISSALHPKDNTVLRGAVWPQSSDATPGLLTGPTMTGPMIERTDASSSVVIERLALKGNENSVTCQAIHVADGSNWIIQDVNLWNFGGTVIKWDAGMACVFRHIYAFGMWVRTGWAAITGVLDLDGSDHQLDYIEATAGGHVDNLTSEGNIVAIVVRGSYFFITNCVAEFAQKGYAMLSGNCQVSNTRADFNSGAGFYITGSCNQFVGCKGVSNCRVGANLADVFSVSDSESNTFIGCLAFTIYGQTPFRYGFADSSNDPGGRTWDISNKYIGCRVYDWNMSGDHNFTGTLPKTWT